MRRALLLLALTACKAPADTAGPAWDFPDVATAMPALRGPGAPQVSFTEGELWTACASLDGGEDDSHHHNLVMPYRGHLVMPWIPEWSGGGVSLFDMSDPCAPEKVGEGSEQTLRESHALGFVHLPEGDPHAGDWMALTGMLGVQIWDLSDAAEPKMASYLKLDGVFYPDSYTRVVLSVFWQYPWLYVAGADNGVYVVDATDPYNPVAVSQYTWDPVFRAGGVFVLGNEVLVTSAEGKEAALLDASSPTELQPIPGGQFATATADSGGVGMETYHGNRVGDLALFARKEGGGGLVVYDISDPTSPAWVSDVLDEHNGGYVFGHEGLAFVGESTMARVYDLTEPTAPTLVGEAWMAGDLDTMTPFGNIAVLSVDDDAEDGVASTIVPWSTTPDTRGPSLLRVDPRDGATGVPVTARIGLGFDEIIEPSSVFAGSIRLYAADGTAVDGWGSGQDNLGSYTPKAPLQPGTTYTIEVVEGGVLDASLNPIAGTFTSTFTTAGG
jgi:hypothetical protein